MEKQDTYQVFDMCYGIIGDRTWSGAYVMLDNGEEAYANHCANLRKGTHVLCSVLKPEQPEKGRLKVVGIDSVLYPSVLAA